MRSPGLPKARPYLDHGVLDRRTTTQPSGRFDRSLDSRPEKLSIHGVVRQDAAIAYALIETLNRAILKPGANPAWVLERIQDHPVKRINELLPWTYQAMLDEQKAAAA